MHTQYAIALQYFFHNQRIIENPSVCIYDHFIRHVITPDIDCIVLYANKLALRLLQVIAQLLCASCVLKNTLI